MLEIITYANKSYGLFEKLIKNEYNIPIKVLGWNTKWNGFSDKYKAMSKYLETKKDTDIIVFLDGFDTKINKNITNLLEDFKKFNCKMLVSRDPNLLGRFLTTKFIFGECRKNNVANSGLYMGYATYVKMVIDEALKLKCSDDQRNLNTICSIFKDIKVDEDEIIFKNISPYRKEIKNNCYFISYPGTFGFKRYIRSLSEYLQFLFFYIIIILLTLLFIFPKYKMVLGIISTIITIFFIFFADKSCIIN